MIPCLGAGIFASSVMLPNVGHGCTQKLRQHANVLAEGPRMR